MSCDFDVIKSLTLASLMWFESNALDVPACQIGLEKAGLTASIPNIRRFLKSGIPIYNFKVPDTTGRKTRQKRRRRRGKRKTHVIAKSFTIHVKRN